MQAMLGYLMIHFKDDNYEAGSAYSRLDIGYDRYRMP
jgi:hypothetical protein